jgi:hypothetical protein
MHSLGLVPLILGGVGAAAFTAALGLWVLGRRKSPEQLERERRRRLSAIGRITDGTVVEIEEVSSNGSTPRQLVIYSYDVAGVSYDAAQDVSYLREHLDLRSCRIGAAASVKYDPLNPGNSIVVAEDWSGLRQEALQPQRT